MLRCHVIMAVFKRNVLSYFSGVIGYLFIIVFVVAGAALAFRPEFFTNNLATLDQLNEYFPHLLLFLIPAITMGAWADEKKLGTDELLFTLPATDLEILLGKYFAVLAVYSVALFFSLTHLLVLAYYADPDWGLLIANYFGYWITGASLLSAGMLASLMTSSTTVAFVLGAFFCAIPVFIDMIAPTNEFIKDLSLPEQFREFSTGLVPLSNVMYFVSLAILMLYLNLVLITRRHWSSVKETSMELQFALRSISLAAILISLNFVAVTSGAVVSLRVDMTAEKIFTLTSTTHDLLDKIDKDKPITIQAFISPEVPRELVDHQRRLYGLLRQYDRMGGGSISVRFVNVEPFSKEADEAKYFGIQPRMLPTQRGGRTSVENVFLGAVISSPFDEVIVPFFDIGIPIEYELTRSIRTVSNEERLTVGILRTDAKITGGFDMSTFRSSPEWQVIAELKKQYEVEEVSPDSAIEEGKFDVLIAVLPSSLTQPQMINFVSYVKTGNPVLIFDDPMPVFSGLQQAPRSPKPRQGGGMMGGGGPPPEQKADGGRATTLLNALEIAWDNGQVTWDATGKRLHPEFSEVIREELVFISPLGGTLSAFSPESDITSDLQEMLTFFPGSIRPRSGSNLKFEPLLRTSTLSGLLAWEDITAPGMFGGVQINPQPPYVPDNDAHVLAAHIVSKGKKENGGINAIYVADSDVVGDELFNIVRGALHGLQLDNIKFVMNAVDVLAGDDAYVDLRKRRAVHRTLTVVQDQAQVFRDERQKAEMEAKSKAETKLAAARERFSKQQEKIENDTSLTDLEKQQKMEIARQTEERRLKVDEANVERDKNDEVEKIKATEQREIRALEDGIRWRAVAIPPIPAIILGIIMLCLRISNERRDMNPNRMMSKN